MKIEELFKASQTGNLSVIKRFIHDPKLRKKDGIDVILSTDKNDRTPIYYACKAGHSMVIIELLKAGAVDDKQTCFYGCLHEQDKDLMKAANKYGFEKIPETMKKSLIDACKKRVDPEALKEKKKNSIWNDSQFSEEYMNRFDNPEEYKKKLAQIEKEVEALDD